MVYIIGLTGGIGSGKSAVADCFSFHGVPVIDTDVVAHSLTVAGGAAMPDILAAFGDKMLTKEGALDRAAMRTHVFAHPEDRKRLEAIIHPLIREAVEKKIQAAALQHPLYLVLVVPLLIESDSYRERVHRIAVVDCPESIQIQRVMQRNGLSHSEVEDLLHAQAKREQRLAAADDLIQNDGEISALAPQVALLHQKYCKLAQQVG